ERLGQENPQLNLDLERATWEAYLVAALELIRQAELRSELSSSHLLTAGDADALRRIRKGIEADLHQIEKILPERLPDVHLLAVGPDGAPPDRLNPLRNMLRANLFRDFARWLPDRDVPRVIDELLDDGWVVLTDAQQQVSRDWYSLISI